MSNITDFIIRSREAGYNPTLAPEDAPAEPSARELVAAKLATNTNARYWQLCKEVINAAGEVAEKDKLVMNFRGTNTRHVVEPVVNNRKNYPNGIESVIGARDRAMSNFFKAVDALNDYSVRHDRDQVLPMRLLSRFSDKEDRDKYKKRIDSLMASSAQPFALDELKP